MSPPHTLALAQPARKVEAPQKEFSLKRGRVKTYNTRENLGPADQRP